jgi:hypothetical protein
MASPKRKASSSGLALGLLACMAAGPVRAEAPATPRLSLLVVTTGAELQDEAARIGAGARSALHRTERVTLVPLVDLLDHAGAAARGKQLQVGRQSLEAARHAYNDLDTDKALRETKRAITAFEQTDLTRHLGELTAAWLVKIASLVGNGETKAAQLEIQKLLAVDATARFSPNYFPPELIAFAERARGPARAGQAKLEVKTTPPGAEVYVDGSYRGLSPLTVEALAPGEHYVTVRSAGHALAQQRAPVGGVSLTLQRAEGWPLYEAAHRRIAEHPHRSSRDEAALELARSLPLEQLILAILDGSPGSSAAQLTLVRLDVADGHNLAFAQERLSLDAHLEQKAQALFERLVAVDDPRRGGPVTHARADPGQALSTRKTAGYALLGAGVVMLAGGTWLGLQASSEADRFRSLPQTDPGAGSVRASGRRFAVFADLSFLTGLAAAGGGGYLAFLHGPPRPAAPPRDMEPETSRLDGDLRND